ncbi:MAG: methyltransferase domain-containing protein [Vicinamibacterales bacterium]|nr:methyltransferase domain-containing protein [Vicinamibacterales bacterium]
MGILIPDLSHRRRETELMDQPGLDIREHRHALAALGRANLVSRTAASLWPRIRRAADAARRTPVRLLDVASGGGQVAISIARRAAREGVVLDITGVDNSPVAVDAARTRAAQAGVERVRFEHIDAVTGAWPDEVDILVCTLFLHHLDEEDAVALLGRMKAAARRLVLVSDLRRSRLGYAFAWAGCRLLSRSRVFHVDGTRSVAAAFTPAEADQLARSAGLAGSSITTHWPQRWLLAWSTERR